MGLMILLLVLIVPGLWLLYLRGYVAVQMKRALLFMGSICGDRARFSGCTGFVRRRFPVAESRVYRFDLALELERGEAWVELLDGDKNVLMRLDSLCGHAEISLKRGRAYHLVMRYQSASGKHSLTYE